MKTAWVSDIEPGPSTILTRRFPDSPNLGDITQIDWTRVEPVDVIAGGSPCTDLSLAGARAGMKPGTRSGLWEAMFTAIKTIRPRLVVWENVRGALSAEAFSLMESREGRVGDGPDGPSLRALGRVLGDLAGIGYDAQWCGVRASDVGAPHQRYRVFVTAHPAGDHGWLLQRESGDATHAGSQRRGSEGHPGTGEAPGGRASALDRGRRDTPLNLLPTPTTQDAKNNGGPSQTERNTPPLNMVVKLMPTPRATDGEKGGPNQAGSSGDLMLPSAVQHGRFGVYAEAIHRWEQVTGRAAPAPTILSAQGNPQLSHYFVEWLMGLPEGWITDPDLWDGYKPSRARNLCLRMAGNGVVPLQAATAINHLTHHVAQLDAT